MAGGEDRRGDGDELGAADLAEHVERVGDAGDAAHGLLHGGALDVSVASSIPVPRPTHAAVSPPARAAATAADAVVLPMPISPTTRRSPSMASTAAQAMSTISAKRSGDSAASKRMSPVGLPMPTSTADTVAPA